MKKNIFIIKLLYNKNKNQINKNKNEINNNNNITDSIY
jgi:hypothetical protein